MMQVEVASNLVEIPNFKRKNFDCKCGCGLNNIDDLFVWMLQETRYKANFPFIVKSGCRCEKHNRDEGGKPTSDHLSGEGADIKVVGSWQRLVIVEAALLSGIKRIGVAKTFVHLGNNLRQNPAGLWTY